MDAVPARSERDDGVGDDPREIEERVQLFGSSLRETRTHEVPPPVLAQPRVTPLVIPAKPPKHGAENLDALGVQPTTPGARSHMILKTCWR